MTNKRKGLREISWGINDSDGGTCIYDNGHIDAGEFLEMVRGFRQSNTPQEARDALSADDVEHLRFRPMSPTEACGWGCDYGVMECDGQRGYPVTAVKF